MERGSPDWRQVQKKTRHQERVGEERKLPLACLQVRISDAEGELRSMVLKILHFNVVTDQIGKRKPETFGVQMQTSNSGKWTSLTTLTLRILNYFDK